MYVSRYVCMYVCMHVYMDVCMCINRCACVYLSDGCRVDCRLVVHPRVALHCCVGHSSKLVPGVIPSVVQSTV